MPTTWEIGSQHIRREIAFDPLVGLYTSHFLNRATGTDLIVQARAEERWAPEFDFRVNGERLMSLGDSWQLISNTGVYPQADFAAQLVLRLHHRTLPVEAWVGYRCDAHGIAKRCWIKNTGSDPITITHLAMESLPIEIGSPGDLQLDAHYGSLPRETFITGRVDDCAIVYRNPRTGDTVIALNEAPGHLKRIETGAWFWDGFVRIMYDTDLFPLEVQLKPNEGWGSASARLILAATGKGYAD